MLDFRKPVRMQWQLIALNAAAALLNLGMFTWNLMGGRWIAAAGLFAGLFSLYITWRLWRKLPEIVAQEQQRIVDILKGKIT